MAASEGSNRRLVGKVAIITGGASGIGATTTRLFVEHGAQVVIANIQDEMGSMLAEEVGARADFVHCDVTKEDEVEALVNQTIAKHGGLDIMFCNAGVSTLVGTVSPMWALDMADFQLTMDINVKGVVHGVKHAARAMIALGKGRGSILCSSSMASVLAQGGGHAYCISKLAVLGVMRSAASELCRHGIRVNAISPFVVETPLITELYNYLMPNLPLKEALVTSSPLMGVHATPDDIAQAALFLVSDDARLINGHNLVVDGGYTISKPLILHN